VRPLTNALGLLVFGAPLVVALPTSPVAIVGYLYAHPDRVYTRDETGLSAAFFAPRLLKLYKGDREAHKGEVPNLDFDFLSDSQDPSVTDVKIAADSSGVQTDHQTVTVHFLEYGKPETELFSFERQKGRWLISEVQCTTSGNEWTLSRIMEGHPE
jgi:hypothetical protein